MMPRSVCKMMERIQRDFLWRGDDADRGMYLVLWERVCTPKKKGGGRVMEFGGHEQSLVV